jgi:predicted aspartyl protease
MGQFQVKVTVSKPGVAGPAFDEAFRVDTGATYSFAPRRRLEAIGLVPDGERTVVFANGQRAVCGIADVTMRIAGISEARTCPIIFGPDDSIYLLGATALERFGVAADPDSRTLKPILASIGGFLASR